MFSPLHGMHLYRWITKFANPVKLAGTQGGPNPGTSCSRIWSKKHLFAVLLFALFVDLDRTTRIMDLTKPYDPTTVITLPLHGVAKTFKFRHRSFGVLPLEK